MAVKVKLPTQLRAAAGGASTVPVVGETVGAVLEALYDEHPDVLIPDNLVSSARNETGTPYWFTARKQGIKLLAETTGIFTETAGGVTTAVLAKLAERGEIDPSERVVAYITGDGLKTLDAVREGFAVTEIAPSLEAFDEAFAPAGAVA